MTLEETRLLGIEFERRIQTMIPEREYNKLDTETIYSFLNQYQDKYIHDIYRNLDNIPSGTKLSAHIESVLQSMLSSYETSIDDAIKLNESADLNDNNGITISDTARSVIYKLPKDFYMYVRSVSKVSSSFSFKNVSSLNNNLVRVLPNELVSQNDVWKLIETPYNSLRILRHPAAVLSEYREYLPKFEAEIEDPVQKLDLSSLIPGQIQPNIPGVGEQQLFVTTSYPTITVIYDQYTTPLGIKVLYYKQPAHFSLFTSVACELPMDVFDDIVTGAVNLYVDYAAGAEAKKRQQQEAALKRALEDQRNARRNGDNKDEQ